MSVETVLTSVNEQQTPTVIDALTLADKQRLCNREKAGNRAKTAANKVPANGGASRAKSLVIMGSIAFAAMFNYSWANAYPNTAYMTIKEFVNDSVIHGYGDDAGLSEVQFGFIWTCVFNVYFAGAVLACVLTPFAAERLGRKPSITVGAVFNLVGTAAMVASVLLSRVELFAIGRFVLGVGTTLGMNCLTLFLQESSPTAVRGLVSSFQELSVCVATVIAMVAGLRSLLGGSLLLLIAIPAIFECLLIVMLTFCPDTPKWLLLQHGSRGQAEHAVLFYHGRHANVDKVIEEIMREHSSDLDTSQCGILRLIKSQDYMLKGALIGAVAGIAQVTSGIFPVTALSTVFLRGAGLSSDAADGGAILMVLVNAVVTVFSMSVVDRFGRRPMLIGLGLATAACLGVFAACAAAQSHLGWRWAGYASLAAMLAFSVCYSLGPGPIPWFVSNELVPQSIRSTVQCIVLGCMMTVNLIISTCTLPLYHLMGAISFLVLFILPSLAAHVFLYRYLPETKNTEISDIVEALKRRRNSDAKGGSPDVSLVEKVHL